MVRKQTTTYYVYNIKMDVKEIKWGGINWMDLAQVMEMWTALLNTVIKLRVS
jgi:hypothetical protein